MEAVRAEAAAELGRRRGQGVAEKTLREHSGQSTRGARQELETAGKLKDLPVTSDAFGEGKISFDHGKIIARTAGQVEIDEKELVDKAKKQPVDVFAHTARKHAQQRSGDDGMSILKQQRRDRKAWINVSQASGMTVLHAQLDPINGTRVKNAMSKMTNEMWRDEDPKHRPTTGQRMADALVELVCGERQDEKKQKIGQGTMLGLLTLTR